MLKYRTYVSSHKIDAVEVERETDISVWVGNRRRAKLTSYDCYFDTWEEAHEFLVDNAERDVECIRLNLERAKGKLGQIKGMKP